MEIWSSGSIPSNYVDPETGLTMVWDSSSQSFIAKPRNDDIYRDNPSGLFDPAQQTEMAQNPLQEGYMAAANGGNVFTHVNCPNCQNLTDKPVCPTCNKDLTPEWNMQQDRRSQLGLDQQPPHVDQMDAMPYRVEKPNINQWDNSFPSMLSNFLPDVPEWEEHERQIPPEGSQWKDTAGTLYTVNGFKDEVVWLEYKTPGGGFGILDYPMHDWDYLTNRGVMQPLNSVNPTQEETDQNWPDTLPWGEGEQEYYRTAGWEENLTQRPREEIGKFIQDRGGQLNYLHGMGLSHDDVATQHGIPRETWGSIGNVYNDGTANVIQTLPGHQHDPNMLQRQLQDAYGPAISLREETQDPGMKWRLYDNNHVELGPAKEHGELHQSYLGSGGNPNVPVVAQGEIHPGGSMSYSPTMSYRDRDIRSMAQLVKMKAAEQGISLNGQISYAIARNMPNQGLQWDRGQLVASNKESDSNNLTNSLGENLKPKPEYFSHALEEQQWLAANDPTLESCPNCHGPMTDKNGERICYSCGAKQPIVNGTIAGIHQGQGPLLPLEAPIVEGLAGEAAGGLGGGAGGLGGGKPPMGIGDIGHTMNKALGWANQQTPQPSVDGMQQGTISHVGKAPFGEDDDEQGLATKDRGDNENPDLAGSSGSGFLDEMGDGLELLKDVGGPGGSQDAHGTDAERSDGMRDDKQNNALKTFHEHMPIVIEFASSGQGDHSLIHQIDQMLEDAFPGYKEMANQSVEESPEDKESEKVNSDTEPKPHEGSIRESIWHTAFDPMSNPNVDPVSMDLGMGPNQMAGGTGCPTCGQPMIPGQPCPQCTQNMGYQDNQGGPTPTGIAGNQQVTLPGSAVKQHIVTHNKWSIDLGELHPSCPNCGGAGVPMRGNGQTENYLCQDCGSPYAQDLSADYAHQTEAPFESGYVHNAKQDEERQPRPQVDDYADLDSRMYNSDWVDDRGQALQEGQEYEMHTSGSYIPDRITLDKITPDKITYTLHSMVDFQGEISKQDLMNEGYSFSPVTGSGNEFDSSDGFNDEHPIRPGQDANPQVDDLSQPSTVMSSLDEYTGSFQGDNAGGRDWLNESEPIAVDQGLLAKIAGKKFTPQEQNDFINEGGVARNLENLRLEGTHYIMDELDDSLSNSMW